MESLIQAQVPSPYGALFGRYSKFLSLSNGFQIKPSGSFGLTLSGGSDEKTYKEFFIGGYQLVRFNNTSFWGLNYGEVAASNFAKVGMDVQVIPAKKIYLRGGVNYLGFSNSNPLKDVVDDSEFRFENDYLGFGADISYQSLLGPITLGMSSNTSDHKLRTYVSVGLSFNYTDR